MGRISQDLAVQNERGDSVWKVDPIAVRQITGCRSDRLYQSCICLSHREAAFIAKWINYSICTIYIDI